MSLHLEDEIFALVITALQQAKETLLLSVVHVHAAEPVRITLRRLDGDVNDFTERNDRELGGRVLRIFEHERVQVQDEVFGLPELGQHNADVGALFLQVSSDHLLSGVWHCDRSPVHGKLRKLYTCARHIPFLFDVILHFPEVVRVFEQLLSSTGHTAKEDLLSLSLRTDDLLLLHSRPGKRLLCLFKRVCGKALHILCPGRTLGLADRHRAAAIFDGMSSGADFVD